MAKAAGTIGKVAGVVATVASFIPGVGQVVAAVAAVISIGANILAASLAKPPAARGSVSRTIVAVDPPTPYVMGEGYYGGIVRADIAYGPTLKKVPNPYRFMPIVYSGAGPIHSISPRIDFDPVSSWYSGFVFTDTQLGTVPEANALQPQWSGSGWGANHKLSGHAGIGWSFLFDKDGERFQSGIPLLGAYGKWVLAYDPRLDSTQPGGSGSHRLGDESTYEWTENPALHAGTYAYGRYHNGKRVMGIGLPADGIDWEVVAAWANVCDANGWKMFGVVYEGVGPGESERRLENLRDICYAGSAQPLLGGKLSFKYHAPVVALDTVTGADLTQDTRSVTAMQPSRDSANTVIYKYLSPSHNWELVDGADPVVNENFLAEDGEARRVVWPFNFVKDKDQAAQLAAYRLFDTRELAPITLVCHPRLRNYRPGECLYLDLPELGLDTPAIILNRQIDPKTMKVTLILMGETAAKHAYCLGQTGVAPPTPAIGQTAEERDKLAAEARAARGAYRIRTYTPTNYAIVNDTSISFIQFNGILEDGREVTFPAHTESSLFQGTFYHVMWDLIDEVYLFIVAPATTEMESSRYVFVAAISTRVAPGGGFPTPAPPPDGVYYDTNTQAPPP